MAAGVICYALILALGLASLIRAQDTPLEYHLQHLEGVRYPSLQHNILEARAYIKDQFRQYDLDLVINQFNTTVVIDNQEKMVTGENIVGVARGDDTEGGVLLVGADYDSTREQSPLENNGAGVAAMLEVARTYMKTTLPHHEYRRAGTVLFVAFDLNTREYAGESEQDERYGQPGSYHFLHQWLWPYINQSADNFVGAIILDSITRFNTDDNSQVLPRGFEQTFPAAHQHITSSGSKGDFMALFTHDTGSSRSHRLTSVIASSHSESPRAGVFRLQELRVVRGAPASIDTLNMLNHQSHFHFWTFHPSAQRTPLTAVLLTDTDVYRQPREKCGPPCTAKEFLTPSRHHALNLTTSTLTKTLLRLQAQRVDGSGNTGVPLVHTLALTSLMVALTQYLH